MNDKMFNPEDFKKLPPEEQKQKLLDLLIGMANPDAFKTVEIPLKEVKFIWTQISKAGMALMLLNKPEYMIDDDDRHNLSLVMDEFVAIIPGNIEVTFENKEKLMTVLTAVILAAADHLAQASKLDEELLMFSRPDELIKKVRGAADEAGHKEDNSDSE